MCLLSSVACNEAAPLSMLPQTCSALWVAVDLLVGSHGHAAAARQLSSDNAMDRLSSLL